MRLLLIGSLPLAVSAPPCDVCTEGRFFLPGRIACQPEWALKIDGERIIEGPAVPENTSGPLTSNFSL